MKFVKQKFTEDISIDFNEFVDCEFENCVVLYHGGSFTLTRPKFKNVRFGVGDAANNTLIFLKYIRQSSPEIFEELFQTSQNPIQSKPPTIN